MAALRGVCPITLAPLLGLNPRAHSDCTAPVPTTTGRSTCGARRASSRAPATCSAGSWLWIMRASACRMPACPSTADCAGPRLHRCLRAVAMAHCRSGEAPLVRRALARREAVRGWDSMGGACEEARSWRSRAAACWAAGRAAPYSMVRRAPSTPPGLSDACV